jgi:ubiquinone/menaquinone biosynthesis C-methylase UbiE
MEQPEMVALIRDGVDPAGQTWADLGAGTGNFTFALRTLLTDQATIYAIDRDLRAVAAIQDRLAREPAGATIIAQQGDASRALGLPALDGVLMANLLHFMRDQAGFLRQVARMLQPHGCLIVVEYEQIHPLPWVPFPVPFARLQALALEAQLAAPIRLAERRSRSSGTTIYAARVPTNAPYSDEQHN